MSHFHPNARSRSRVARLARTAGRCPLDPADGPAVPPPAWLSAAYSDIHDALLAVESSPAYLDSAVTLAAALARIEIDALDRPLIGYRPGGGLSAEWSGMAVRVVLVASGRSVAVAAHRRTEFGDRPVESALSRRDDTGAVIPEIAEGVEPGVTERLRRGLAWMTRWEGTKHWEMVRDASVGGMAI